MDLISDHWLARSSSRLENLLEILLICADNHISRAVFDHMFGLHSPEDIHLSNSCGFGDICNSEGFVFSLKNKIDDLLNPPTKVRLFAEIRERTFRGTYFIFH
jgi:hypothetical protein